MRRVRRWLLICACAIPVGAGAAYWYFLYTPAPEVPRLGSSVVYDSIRVRGLVRSYAFYAPANLAPGAPLVLALHGSMGNAERMRRATGYGFERLADRHGFIVAYPEGYDHHWNDCRKEASFAARRLGIDDVGYLRALVARFRSEYGVDSTRIYAVGVSNGGHMIYRLALEAPDLVRAVAAVGANMPAAESMECTPVRGRTSVLILNGTADPINPYDGGNVTLFGFGNRGRVVSARESAAYFARRNGITDPSTTEQLAQPEPSATSAERTVWSSTAGTEVRLYTIRNGGHTIPQPQARFPRILGRTHAALDGPAEIWRFFTRQAVS
ncbi:MAG: alpha/beta hydrolase family esterase [Gemmatimonadota bacterium]